MPLDALYNPHATSVSGFCISGVQPLLERENRDSFERGGCEPRDTREGRWTRGEKCAESGLVASNWNTILTPKPKIGEYSSLSLSLLLPSSRKSCFSSPRKKKIRRRGEARNLVKINGFSSLPFGRRSEKILFSAIIDASPRVHAPLPILSNLSPQLPPLRLAWEQIESSLFESGNPVRFS